MSSTNVEGENETMTFAEIARLMHTSKEAIRKAVYAPSQPNELPAVLRDFKVSFGERRTFILRKPFMDWYRNQLTKKGA